MFAIIKTGGKQYKVSPGDRVVVEKLAEEPGQIRIGSILMAYGDDGEFIGNPTVEDSYVELDLVKNFKDDKVIVFKKKRRHNYRRKVGHRQVKSLVRVSKICIQGNDYLPSSLPERKE